MHIQLKNNEEVVRQGMANHFEAHIRMTGKLFATNQRLYFVTHKLNFRNYDLSIPLENITAVQLKNNLGLFSHGFMVQLKNGQAHHFVAWKRKEWKALIEELAEKNRNA